jgi:Ca2+-binding RTX toxin-like protein
VAMTAGHAEASPHAKDKAKVHVKVKHDVLVVRGTTKDDNIVLRLQAGRQDLLEVDAGADGSADARVDRGRFDSIVVTARRGADAVRIDEVNGVFTDTEQTTIAGGRGDDELLGGSGVERFFGDSGDDFVDGNRGNDVADLGDDEDVFRWDPGDGSDVVEGNDGYDAMQFNGAGADEQFDVSANGPRVRYFRNVGNITMDLDDVEQIDTTALGGADTFTQHDLSGTDLIADNVDLAGALGGTAGDGGADSVVVEGTSGDDAITVDGGAAGVTVGGLATRLTIAHSEAANDKLAVNALAGDDVVTADGLAAGALHYAADGGTDDDVLVGSAGDDVLTGGAGDDVLIGGPGNDALDGGPGDNVVIQ